MQNHHYQYERLSKSNMADAYSLYLLIKGNKLSLPEFEAKYNTQWFHPEPVCFLAYHGNTPVGFMGTIPFLANHRGRIFPALQNCDAITHPNHAKRGIFLQLNQRIYDVVKPLGIEFVFALHSEASYKATIKLGWKKGIELTRYHLYPTTLPMRRLAMRTKVGTNFTESIFLKTFRPYILPSFLKQNPLVDEGFIAYHYSEEYFRYKLLSPKYFIEINGVVFWVKLRSVLEVGAVWFTNTHQLKQSVQQLTTLCAKAFINEVQFHAPQGSAFQIAMAQFLQPLPSWRTGYLLFNENLNGLRLGFWPADLDTF